MFSVLAGSGSWVCVWESLGFTLCLKQSHPRNSIAFCRVGWLWDAGFPREGATHQHKKPPFPRAATKFTWSSQFTQLMATLIFISSTRFENHIPLLIFHAESHTGCVRIYAYQGRVKMDITHLEKWSFHWKGNIHVSSFATSVGLIIRIQKWWIYQSNQLKAYSFGAEWGGLSPWGNWSQEGGNSRFAWSVLPMEGTGCYSSYSSLQPLFLPNRRHGKQNQLSKGVQCYW